jgi:hypothetical protein
VRKGLVLAIGALSAACLATLVVSALSASSAGPTSSCAPDRVTAHVGTTTVAAGACDGVFLSAYPEPLTIRTGQSLTVDVGDGAVTGIWTTPVGPLRDVTAANSLDRTYRASTPGVTRIWAASTLCRVGPSAQPDLHATTTCPIFSITVQP